MTPLTDAQRDLIERIGVLHDRVGIRPAAGRILGLLLVSPESELTFDEIRETLGLSKSATSTSLEHLQTIGSVEYRTRPGDRKRYFRKNVGEWEQSLLDRMDRFFAIRGLLQEVLELRDERDDESRHSTERMIDFLGFLQTEIHEAYRRWEGRDGPVGATPSAGERTRPAENP